MSEALLVTVGAGVGSAIMTHGQVLAGAHGAAGEIGHISVDPGGLKCGCGGGGCLETFASEPWLARRYTLASRQAVLGREVVKRAATGDADAARVWEQAAGALALTIGTAVVLLDCELVILAGVLASGDLASAIAARLETRIKLVSPPRVRPAVVGEAAGVFGAAAAAFERLGMAQVTGTRWDEPAVRRSLRRHSRPPDRSHRVPAGHRR